MRIFDGLKPLRLPVTAALLSTGLIAGCKPANDPRFPEIDRTIVQKNLVATAEPPLDMDEIYAVHLAKFASFKKDLLIENLLYFITDPKFIEFYQQQDRSGNLVKDSRVAKQMEDLICSLDTAPELRKSFQEMKATMNNSSFYPAAIELLKDFQGGAEIHTTNSDSVVKKL